MSSREFSDLPWGVKGDNVVLVQPERAMGVPKEELLSGEGFEGIFNDACGLSLLEHVGSVCLDNYTDVTGEPISWRACGGSLQIKCAQEGPEYLRKQGKFILVCSRAECRMKLVINDLDRSEISSLMLHLMLKQMVKQKN